MALVVFTGGARSGKSAAAQRLVERRHREAVVVVCAHSIEDPEMMRRVAKHRAARPAGFRTLEVHEGMSWTVDVREDEPLLLDCLGTLVGLIVGAAFGMEGETARGNDEVGAETEADVQEAVDGVVDWLIARTADTVVVTNEVGDGIVPAYPDARLFRDVVGRANRRLVEAAEASYLVVAGRLLALSELPAAADWPRERA